MRHANAQQGTVGLRMWFAAATVVLLVGISAIGWLLISLRGEKGSPTAQSTRLQASPTTDTSPREDMQSSSSHGSAAHESSRRSPGPSLSIASIGLDTSLSAQGLRGGEINPGPGQVIWFTGYDRVAPGEVGVAVVAGHVVSGSKPDVFTNLSRVAVGDRVVSVDKSGTATIYTVTRAYTVSKEDLRRDPAVWGGSSDGKRLALVTCDDALGLRSDGHRVANFVVIAIA